MKIKIKFSSTKDVLEHKLYTWQDYNEITIFNNHILCVNKLKIRPLYFYGFVMSQTNNSMHVQA